MSTEDVDARLAARGAEDRRQARATLLLSVPTAAGAWLFLSWMLTALLWIGAGLRLGPAFAVAAPVVAVLLLVDTWRRPSEAWHRARYFVPSGVDGPAAGDGLFAGMPLMASVSDPGNLAERGREISSGCANVALGGPRGMRRGIELLRLARAREAAAPALRAFLEWLAERGPVPEAELAQALAGNELRRRGWAVARDLGLLAVRPGPGGRTVQAKA